MLLAVLLLGLPAPAALAAPRLVVLTGPDALAPEAQDRVLRRLGSDGGPQVVTVPALLERVRVVGLDRRAEDAGCGGPIWLEDWQARVDRVEVDVQLLDFNGALAGVSQLELEVGCLDRVPDRQDLLRLHLAAATAALLASRTSNATMQRFYADRMVLAGETARGLGDDLLLPTGVDPAVQRLVDSVTLPPAVAVAVAGPGGQVFVDGLPLGRSGARLAPGLRLVQLRSGDGATEVTAASLYPLELPTLFHAGPLRRDQLAEDLAAVAQGLPASELVRALDRLLGGDLAVAWLSPRGVSVRGLDGVPLDVPGGEGQQASGTSAAEREVVLTWADRWGIGGPDRPLVVGLGLCSTWTTLDDPVAGDLGGPAGGIAVWLRVPTRSWVTVAATLHPVARREPLPDGYDADWLYRATVPVRVGVRAEGTFDDRRWEVGVDGVLWALGPYAGAQRVIPGLALAGAVTRPVIDSRFALRLEGHGLAGIGVVGGGLVAGLDSTW